MTARPATWLLISIRKSKPIPANRVQKLYMANLLFMQKQYDQAQSLLRASFSHVLPYNAQEEKLLKDLSLLVSKMKDHSPHAGAIVCTALSLLPGFQDAHIGKDPLKFDRLKEAFIDIAESYLYYKQQAGVVPHLKLQSHEEELALNYLLDAIDAIITTDMQLQVKKQSAKPKPDQKFMSLLFRLESYLGAEQKDKRELLSRFPAPIIDTPESTKIDEVIKIINESSKSQKTQPLVSEKTSLKLLTRPNKQEFLKEFSNLYSQAISNPSSLRLFMVGAEIASDLKSFDLPGELLTLLRSAAYCRQHPELASKDFPPSVDTLDKIIKEKDQWKFSGILHVGQCRGKENPRGRLPANNAFTSYWRSLLLPAQARSSDPFPAKRGWAPSRP